MHQSIMSSIQVLFALLLCLDLVHSALHLPLRHDHNAIHERIQERAEQAPLMDVDPTSSPHPKAPMKEGGEWLAMTSLSIGTPPQKFSALISLVRPEMFAFSTLMKPDKESKRTYYSSSLSSTYTANGTKKRIRYPVASASGILSKDNIELADILVSAQTFTEAARVGSYIESSKAEYDAVLGLGQGDNLVTQMYKQGLIEENIFTVVVARDGGQVGELRLGSVEKEKEMAWIETTELKPADFADQDYTQWGMNVTSISFGPAELGIHYGRQTLFDQPAWLRTDLMWIALPGDLAFQIHTHIGATDLGWGFWALENCDDIKNLPDLSFRFGEEELVFNITSSDYLLGLNEDDGGPPFCLSLLTDMFESENELFLGYGFFRGYEVSFDGQGKRIGLVKRSSE